MPLPSALQKETRPYEVFEQDRQNLDDPNTLVYLLAYKDGAARQAGWAAFNANPEWTKLRLKYFVPLSAKVTFMSATDYSPSK